MKTKDLKAANTMKSTELANFLYNKLRKGYVLTAEDMQIIHEVSHAIRAKAIQETVETICIRANHMASGVKHQAELV